MSPCNEHNPYSIWARLTPVINALKLHFPTIKTQLIFYSDGPTKYRQKLNFVLFSKLTKEHPQVNPNKWCFHVPQDTTGLLFWQERVQTSCSFSFWGVHSTSILDTNIIRMEDSPTSEEVEKLRTLPLYEKYDYTRTGYDRQYNCIWCHNDLIAYFTRKLVRRIPVEMMPAGAVRRPSGVWTHRGNSIYYNNMEFLAVLPVQSS